MAKNPARLALLCSGLFLSHVFEAWGSQLTNVQTVFVIVMENKDWTAIHGNSDCPYINNTLLSVASHAEQYFSPPGLVKSEPNYLWLEAGTNFGINNDDLPAANHISTAKHLVTLLENAGISWRTYQESYNPDGKTVTSCVFCHHTDEPKESLKPPLTTSERPVALTADVLKDAAATPVKACRTCHLQAGDDSKQLPVVTKDGKQMKMDNENAYHINCFECHDAAIKAKPELAGKISGSDAKGCAKCHVAK